MPACRRLRQENCCKFEANLGYLAKVCLKNKNAFLPKSTINVLLFCIFFHPPKVTAEMSAAGGGLNLLVTVCMEHQRCLQGRGQGLFPGSNDCMAWLCTGSSKDLPEEKLPVAREVALASWSLFFHEG